MVRFGGVSSRKYRDRASRLKCSPLSVTRTTFLCRNNYGSAKGISTNAYLNSVVFGRTGKLHNSSDCSTTESSTHRHVHPLYTADTRGSIAIAPKTAGPMSFWAICFLSVRRTVWVSGCARDSQTRSIRGSRMRNCCKAMTQNRARSSARSLKNLKELGTKVELSLKASTSGLLHLCITKL